MAMASTMRAYAESGSCRHACLLAHLGEPPSELHTDSADAENDEEEEEEARAAAADDGDATRTRMRAVAAAAAVEGETTCGGSCDVCARGAYLRDVGGEARLLLQAVSACGGYSGLGLPLDAIGGSRNQKVMGRPALLALHNHPHPHPYPCPCP